MLLALQVKVGKVASFVGKIFVVRPSTTNILPHENYPLQLQNRLKSVSDWDTHNYNTVCMRHKNYYKKFQANLVLLYVYVQVIEILAMHTHCAKGPD